MPKEKKETVNQELTIINNPSKAITLYKITPAEIAERLKAYDSLKVVEGDPKSYKEVRSVLTALVRTRTGVEERRLVLGRNYRGLVEKSISNINKAAEMLANPMAPYEERFKSELKTEDARLDGIKAEKIHLEEERKENIRAEIFKIQESAMPTVLGVMILEHLRELSTSLEDMEITVEEYQEFTDEATKVLDDSYNAVQDAITARIKLNNEEARRRAEAERLAKIQLKQEADQVVIDKANLKIRLAQKKIDDDKAELAAEKQAEADRKEREKFEKEATKKAEATAAQKVVDDALKKEAKKKADEAEKAREEALKPDRSKMEDFANYLQENIPYPELQLDEFRDLLKSVRTQIYDIGNEILEALSG